MYMRAVTFRIVYLGIASAAILLSVALRDATVQAAPTTPAPRAVNVLAPLSLVTLPTVHVTAVAEHGTARTPAEARQRAVAAHQHASGIEHADTDTDVSAALPSLRLDMPYYSFGTLLPRVRN
jgi:hypothetical protein